MNDGKQENRKMSRGSVALYPISKQCENIGVDAHIDPQLYIISHFSQNVKLT